MTTNNARHTERTSVMKQTEFVFTRGLVVAALCLTAGIAQPGRGEEATQGTGKVADTNSFRIAADSPEVVVKKAPTGLTSSAPLPGPAAGRVALAQPGCSICLGGTGSIQWTGGSGSFHVDSITNNRFYGTGSLDLGVTLSSSLPVFGQPLVYYQFSDLISLPPLAVGDAYLNVNSGTVNFGNMPAGLYWALLYLREYQGGGVFLGEDWIVMPKMVSCNGASCALVTPCVEDAYTMCLVNGRYRVTSHWRNQYAGGATANLFKAKLTDTTGAFWIADANTYEYMIRLQPGQSNGRTWIAIPTFTDVEFWIDVTDTQGQGQSKSYPSAPGNRTLLYDPYFFVYP
jgi:hypothetical protein